MKLFVRLTVVILVLLAFYNIWVITGIPPTDDVLIKTTVQPNAIINNGSDSGKGNIIAIQPYLKAINYSNEPSFKESIRPFLQAAKAQKLLNKNTVVVFPDHIGSWLIAFEEKEAVYKKTSFEAALNAIIMGNLFKYTVAYITAPKGVNKKLYAVYAMKARQISEVYNRVFSNLAKEFSVTIYAGSMVLPNPSINNTQQLMANKGDLFVTSTRFNPNGSIVSPLEKTPFAIQGNGTFNSTQAGTLVQLGTGNQIQLAFSGTIWDQQAKGNVLATINNTVTAVPAINNGRMINWWIY